MISWNFILLLKNGPKSLKNQSFWPQMYTFGPKIEKIHFDERERSRCVRSTMINEKWHLKLSFEVLDVIIAAIDRFFWKNWNFIIPSKNDQKTAIFNKKSRKFCFFSIFRLANALNAHDPILKEKETLSVKKFFSAFYRENSIFIVFKHVL